MAKRRREEADIQDGGKRLLAAMGYRIPKSLAIEEKIMGRPLSVDEICAGNKGFVFDLSQPRATKQTEGLPDLMVYDFSTRKKIWIEVKSPKGRLTAEQGILHRCGVTHVARSPEEIANIVRENAR